MIDLISITSIILIVCGVVYYVLRTTQTDFGTRLSGADSNYYRSRIVVITGASSGVGAGLARELVKRGVLGLVLLARSKDKLEALRNELGGAAKVKIVVADLADMEKLPSVWTAVESAFGRVDVLVNNAGMTGIAVHNLAHRQSDQVDIDMMNTNFMAAARFTKFALPKMIERNSGHIVAVSSYVGAAAIPTYAMYTASKHAMHGFFNALRYELIGCGHTGVCVSVVAPGAVQSETMMAGGAAKGSFVDQCFARQSQSVTTCARNFAHAVAARRNEAWLLTPMTLEQLGFYMNFLLPGRDVVCLCVLFVVHFILCLTGLYPTLVGTKVKELCAEFAQ
jgi:dehydrogenase/reductase SDR family protein 7B